MHVGSEEASQAISSQEQVNETVIDIYKTKDTKENSRDESFSIFVGIDKVFNTIDNGCGADRNSINVKRKAAIN